MKSASWVLVLGLLIVGCASGEDAESEGAASSTTSGDEVTGAESGPVEGTTTASENPFAVSEGSSDALQQAEWLRGEQVRGFRMLEMRLDRGDLPCDEAQSVADRLCSISDEICDQAGIDRAARAQCDDSMERCGSGRALMREQSCD